MIARIGPVTNVQATGTVDNVNVFRNPDIPTIDTNALTVDAATLGLPTAVGSSIAQGVYLNAATATEPVAVLGAAAAQRLGIDRIWPGERIWIDNQWFYLAGILKPAALAPEIDSSVLVGYPAAEHYLGFDGHPTEIYVRSDTDQVNAVQTVLAATANPENPSEVDVSQPSAALVAQADAKGALNSLFLGLGAVSLLVGAVGVGNVMLIGVLERRSEIGLRRALGATKGHIRVQFLTEAVLHVPPRRRSPASLLASPPPPSTPTPSTGPWSSPPKPGPAASPPPCSSARLQGCSPPCAPRACHPPKRCGACEALGTPMDVVAARHWSHRRPMDPRRTRLSYRTGVAATKSSTMPWPASRTKCSTDTLRRAERDGLVARHLDSGRVDTATLYQLTDLGRSLDEPLAALDRLGRR